MRVDDELLCSSQVRLHAAHLMEARDFELEHFAGVRAFDDQPALLRHTIARVDPALETWIELGVASGRSTRALAKLARGIGPHVHVHAFDSFQGLPEDFIDGVPAGAFATTPPVFTERNITLHPGWFHDTLRVFAQSLRSQIGFIHVDADLYSSTKTALDAFGPRIGPGTALLFDEYWNFPGCYEHEFRAFQEFIQASGLRFEYLGYNKEYSQASVLLLPAD
jgi:hypothetical protein